ncbi:apoptosis-associated speck-like protein containing a CARD [Kryptolebias marmoratus]|uniref:apoptosis-associated speck-like protein containing a CARD n=1 Tax=Kryptolebias marmoratus TaxID=37003 RepID=UPI000D530C83|nr:apoptosis-associated speck-like protein containing a CARD [Kryptolebias marmoratus]
MPPRSAKKLLSNALEDLSQANYKKFCSELLNPQDGRDRVRRNQVEGKDFLDLADVMVGVYTEKGALKVAVEILQDIGCKQDAEQLAKDAGLNSSGAASSDEEHFVDKHRAELIKRVNNISPILDQLLDKKVIQDEVYDNIRSRSTNTEKMRGIFDGPMRAGRACKDAFYEILKEQEPYLIADLQGK